jgi:hypothetical protein
VQCSAAAVSGVLLTDAFMMRSMLADWPHLLATTTQGVEARRLLSFTPDTLPGEGGREAGRQSQQQEMREV